MATYTVTWTIDVDADNPEEAAETAWQFMHDPDTLATVLDVRPYAKQKPITRVDVGERL